MANDKAKHQVLPPTKFGLIQITRQRVRPEMTIETEENCPMCSGNGKTDSSLLLIEQIERKINTLIQEHQNKIEIKRIPLLLVTLIKKKAGFLFLYVKNGKRNIKEILLSAQMKDYIYYNIVLKITRAFTKNIFIIFN